MKVTMYKLLGLVKDGKAPRKIKYDNIIFEYDGIYYMTEHTYLDEYCDLSRVLNDTVEIIEEEHKIPGKITMRAELFGDINNKIENLNINQIAIEDKINEIIDYLEELK